MALANHIKMNYNDDKDALYAKFNRNISNWASKFKYEDLSGTDVNYTRRVIDYFAASLQD